MRNWINNLVLDSRWSIQSMDDRVGVAPPPSERPDLVVVPCGKYQTKTSGRPVFGSSSGQLCRDGLLCFRLGMAKEPGY